MERELPVGGGAHGHAAAELGGFRGQLRLLDGGDRSAGDLRNSSEKEIRVAEEHRGARRREGR